MKLIIVFVGLFLTSVEALNITSHNVFSLRSDNISLSLEELWVDFKNANNKNYSTPSEEV